MFDEHDCIEYSSKNIYKEIIEKTNNSLKNN